MVVSMHMFNFSAVFCTFLRKKQDCIHSCYVIFPCKIILTSGRSRPSPKRGGGGRGEGLLLEA